MNLKLIIAKILFKVKKEDDNVLINHYNNKISEFLFNVYSKICDNTKQFAHYRISDIKPVINETFNNFNAENKDFVMDIRTDMMVELQIVHTSNLNHFKEEKNELFGFSIHLSLDTKNRKSSLRRKKLKKMKLYQELNKYNISNHNFIYTKDYETDLNKLTKDVVEILQEVYNCTQQTPIIIEVYGNK